MFQEPEFSTKFYKKKTFPTEGSRKTGHTLSQTRRSLGVKSQLKRTWK